MTWRQRKPPVSVSPCNVLHLSQMFLLMGACLTLMGKIGKLWTFSVLRGRGAKRATELVHRLVDA